MHVKPLSSQQAFAIFNNPLLYKPNSHPPPFYVNLPPLKPMLPWPDEPSLPPPVVFNVTGGHVSAVRPSQHDPRKEEQLVLGNARRYAPSNYEVFTVPHINPLDSTGFLWTPVDFNPNLFVW